MPASSPYRIPELGTAAPRPETDDALQSALSLTTLSLVGWSLVRLAVCSLRGLDLEGCAALVLVVAMTRSLVNTWSRFS